MFSLTDLNPQQTTKLSARANLRIFLGPMSETAAMLVRAGTEEEHFLRGSIVRLS